jgi:hypothetical protein
MGWKTQLESGSHTLVCARLWCCCFCMLFVCCVLYAVWDCLLACLQTRPGVSEPVEASGPVRPGAGPGGFEGKRPWQPVQWNNFAKILLMSGPPGASLFSPCVFFSVVVSFISCAPSCWLGSLCRPRKNDLGARYGQPLQLPSV